MSQWQQETTVNKAKCMAHCLHKELRESYIQDQQMQKIKGDKKGGSSYESFMSSFM